MKQFLTMLCLLACLLLCGCQKAETVPPKAEPLTPSAAPAAEAPAAEAPPADVNQIANGQVCGIRPGMALSEAEKAVGKENVRLKKVTYTPEGVPEEVTEVEILVNGKVAIKSMLSAGRKLTAIGVVDPQLKTPEGISVHSTIGEIRKAYPDLKTEFMEGYYAESEKAGLCFNLKDMGTEPTDRSKISEIVIVMK